MSSIDDPIDSDRIQELLQKDSYVDLDECKEMRKLHESGMDPEEVIEATKRSKKVVLKHIEDRCIHARG